MIFKTIHKSISQHLEKKTFSVATHVPQSLKPFLYNTLFDSSNTSSKSLVILISDTSLLFEYSQFFKEHDIPCYLFPFYDLIPYEESTISPSLLAERAKTLQGISLQQKGIYLVPLKSFIFPCIFYQEYQDNFKISLKVDEIIHRATLVQNLVQWGYIKQSQVSVSGTFSIRGETIDIFSPNYTHPIRLNFFDDTLESIRFFSIDKTPPPKKDSLESVSIVSLYDFIFNSPKQDQFLQFLKKEFGPDKVRHFTDQNHQFNIHLAPFFYKQNQILDFFTQASHPFRLVIDDIHKILSKEKTIIRELKELYSGSFNIHKIMLHPHQYLIPFESIIKKHSNTEVFSVSPFNSPENTDEKTLSFQESYQSNTLYQGRVDLLNEHLANDYKNYTIYLISHSEEQTKKLQILFPEFKITLLPYWNEGFADTVNKNLFLTHTDIFGKKTQTNRKILQMFDKTAPIDHFSDISQGDFVVHIQHGIGIYDKIEKVSMLGKQKDFIKIIYADEEALYIPIEQINLVHKYLGSDSPKINNLGGKKWAQKKARALQKMEDMSEELALLYESRKQLKGFQFSKDTPFQTQFESLFPFEETQGQLQAIEDIKNDMESPFIMDRLICGDVGYGKTEVAMRAVFKAVADGKQVAMIAPTVLLVEQHYQSFRKRFSIFPVQIKMLSRIVTSQQKTQTLQGLKEGKVDIVIGTHALLSEKIQFKDLGLFVIDEEQRFGVKHKEKLKQIKNNIDAITLSATPIPRTLYMGLSQIRDMSLISTPPLLRLPIKTYVMPFNEDLLKAGIEKELDRNGQIFIIHNRVKTIETYKIFIQKLFPSARILVGHGKMNPQEMEEIFLDFMEHQADILISTTIIENGIDIPNANTIIIDKPELLGLSELYQLRGRVGRSNKQGYAYLFYDAVQGLSAQMQKRLETIEENTELGSGFKIAMRDLEIRGAGNLLGKDQSGVFEDVGIELYTKMLKQALLKIQGKPLDPPEVLLDLPFNGYLPENYISSEAERFIIYKNLMQSKDEDSIKNLHEYLETNYGKTPSDIEGLFSIARIKVLCKKLLIKEIKYDENCYTFFFQGKPSINTAVLVPFIQAEKIKIVNTETLVVQKNILQAENSFLDEIEEFLKICLS